MDSFLITLVVIGIAAISSWLQRRAQDQEEHTGGPPSPTPSPRPGPPPAPGRSRLPPRSPIPNIPPTLARELRRLMGEDFPTPIPPPVRPPPLTPPVLHPPSRPEVQVLPTPVAALPVPSLSGPAVLRPNPAMAGFDRAQQLHESVAARLNRVDEQTQRHPHSLLPAAAAGSAAREQIAALRRNPGAVRQAFITSLIFNHPKALEE
jgi:hypothetical protein